MYTSLEIKGFRCFKHLTIPKLARLNLIGGKNNTGKTALLEGIAFRAAVARSPDAIPALYQVREVDLAKAGFHFGFRDLFCDGLQGWEVSVATGTTPPASGADGGTAVFTMSGAPVAPMSVQVDVAGEASVPRTGPVPGRSSALLNLDLALEEPGQEPVRASARWEAGKIQLATTAPPLGPQRLYFVTTKRLANGTEAAQRLAMMQISGQAGPVVGTLKVVEPGLTDLRVVPAGDGSVVYAEVSGRTFRPLGMLGEGMNRLLDIAVGLGAVPGYTLLIDEVETGLHYSVMPDVWRAIAQAASELDVQVFATTHSHECVEAAYEATEGMPEDTFLYHRLDRVDEGIVCRTYRREVLAAAFETELEVR
jgi:hypothetical protein